MIDPQLAVAVICVLVAAALGGKLGYERFLLKEEKPRPPFPRVLFEKLASNSECSWIKLKKVYYADQAGNRRVWEKAERPTRRSGCTVDGVMIVARIKGGSRDGCVPLVSQFRPPVGKKTLEFPAGLVDANETVEAAALRELKEETGLIGEVVSVSPPLYLDPGMSPSCCSMVELTVDGTRPENMNPVQQLDQGEFCEVLYIKNPTVSRLKDLSHDLVIDANVYMWCVSSL